MRKVNKYLSIVLMLLFSIFLMAASNGGQNGDETEQLLERQKQLIARIETLTAEQDFLVFQKTMYASDTKYLIISLAAKKGQLKYKNRVLKDFRFERISDRKAGPAPGALTLTKKIEGPRERNLLLFGKALVLHGKQPPPTRLEKGIARLGLSKKDFMSVYYAIEVGAKAYVVR